MTYSGKKQPAPTGNSPPLKQKKSRLFLKLAIGVASLLVLLIILILSVNLNTFREPVTKALSQATGLRIKVEFLDWGFSEGLKIKCEGVQIQSGETEEELVSTKELLIKLKWLPLLQRHVVIKSITLVEPVLKIPIQSSSKKEALPQSEQSSSDTLPNSSQPKAEEPSSSNGFHNIREFLKNPNFTLTEINLIAGRVILQDKGVGTETVLNAEAQMRIRRDENRIDLVLDDIKLGTGNLLVLGEIHTDDFLLQGSPVQANIQIQPFKVSDLLPVLKWNPEIQDAINKKLMLKGDFHELELKLESPIESMTDFDSLIKSADADLVLKGRKISLVQYGKTISASKIEADIQWVDRQWAHKIALGMLGGNLGIEGKMFHGKAAKSALDLTLDSHIILEKIHLDELKKTFPHQVSSFPETGTLSGKVHAQGPVLRPQSLRAEGTVNSQNVSFPLRGTHVSIAGMEGSGQWLGDRLNHKIRMTALGGKITIKGGLKFKKDNQGQWDPVIDSEVVPRSIKLADLRPLVQKDWFPKKGTLAGTVHVQGPVLRPQSLRAEGKMKVLDTSIRYQETNIHFPAINGTGRWIKNRLIHEVMMEVFGGNVEIKGHLKMNKIDQDEWKPVIHSDVSAQSVQLSSLRPLVQKDWFPKKGTLAGTVHVQGPMLQPVALQAKGHLKFLNLEVNVKDTPVPIPVIDVEGAWANSHLVHDLKLKVFDGDMQVKGRLHYAKDRQGNRNPVIDSKVFIRPVSLIQLKPLVAQNWFPDKGVLDGTVQVRGPMLNPKAIKAEGNLRVQNTAFQYEGKNIVLAEIKGKGFWSKGHLSHHIKTNLFGGEVSIQGDLNFKKNNQGELDPVIHSDVIPRSLQLASIRPFVQKDWFPKKGNLTGKFHLKGPVKRFSEIPIIGNLAGEKVVLKIEKKPVIFQKAFLSFEPNAQNNILMGFNLSDISVGKLSLKKSTGKMIFSKGTFEVKQGKIWPKTGVLFLNGVYMYKSKDYKFEFSGKGLRLEDFEVNYLEGPLNLQGDIFGSILSEGFKKGLSGNLTINSKNGRIITTGPVLTKILDIINFKITPDDNEILHYDFLGGNCTIKNGILFTEDLKMISPSVHLFVSGKADLSDEKYDAEAMVQSLLTHGKLLDKLDKLMGGLGIFGGKRKEGKKSEDWIKAYFSISGNFKKPKVELLPEKTFMFK